MKNTLFRQGELGRLIMDAMRDADGPINSAGIVAHVVAAGGHGDSASPALVHRVRTNLQYLQRRGKVNKSGNGRYTVWTLA